MDCAASDGGLRLGGRSGLSRSRSRTRLWGGIHPAASRDGQSRPTNCTAIALAERLGRTPDWLDQAGGTRSRRRAWRASPSARTAILHGISQPGPHAFVAEQRRADSTRSSRRRSDLRKASSWWSASPIRSDLIYDRDREGIFAIERDPMAFETLSRNMIDDAAPYKEFPALAHVAPKK